MKARKRELRGGLKTVTMARAKPCESCGESNDSPVTRHPDSRFSHYALCSGCRDGDEVRRALKYQPRMEEDRALYERAYPRDRHRFVASPFRRPALARVTFRADSPGVETYEVVVQVRDGWRAQLHEVRANASPYCKPKPKRQP